MILSELIVYPAKYLSKSNLIYLYISTNPSFSSHLHSSETNNFLLEFTDTTNVMKIEPWFKIHKKFNERNLIDYYNIQDIILGKPNNGQPETSSLMDDFNKADYDTKLLDR